VSWVVADPEHLGGKPRIAGTRISVEMLLESLACGMTIPEIISEYPTLSEEAIRGALLELARSERRRRVLKILLDENMRESVRRELGCRGHQEVRV
jgi:uncharacterized protein (DUF433 family)